MTKEIMPFGKYKGHPVEVAQSDESYWQWLQGQDWFRNKFSQLNVTIINNNTAQDQETPEHNQMQSLFSDWTRCKALMTLVHGPFEDFKGTRIRAFEHQNWDLFVSGVCYQIGPTQEDSSYDTMGSRDKQLLCELKPSLGDDYPSVVRKMRKQLKNSSGLSEPALVLVYKQYNGSVPIETVSNMFSDIKFIQLSQIM